MLPRGLGARLPHLRAAGRRGRILHRRHNDGHRRVDTRRISRLRDNALSRRENARGLPALLRRGREPLPSAPRDGDARALREAPPEGAIAREPHGMPAKPERDRLSGRLRLHGRLALSDDGGPRARPALHKKLRAADGGHRAVHSRTTTRRSRTNPRARRS